MFAFVKRRTCDFKELFSAVFSEGLLCLRRMRTCEHFSKRHKTKPKPAPYSARQNQHSFQCEEKLSANFGAFVGFKADKTRLAPLDMIPHTRHHAATAERQCSTDEQRRLVVQNIVPPT